MITVCPINMLGALEQEKLENNPDNQAVEPVDITSLLAPCTDEFSGFKLSSGEGYEGFRPATPGELRDLRNLREEAWREKSEKKRTADARVKFDKVEAMTCRELVKAYEDLHDPSGIIQFVEDRLSRHLETIVHIAPRPIYREYVREFILGGESDDGWIEKAAAFAFGLRLILFDSGKDRHVSSEKYEFQSRAEESAWFLRKILDLGPVFEDRVTQALKADPWYQKSKFSSAQRAIETLAPLQFYYR